MKNRRNTERRTLNSGDRTKLENCCFVEGFAFCGLLSAILASIASAEAERGSHKRHRRHKTFSFLCFLCLLWLIPSQNLLPAHDQVFVADADSRIFNVG